MPLKVIKSRPVRVTANGKICSANPKKKSAPRKNAKRNKSTWGVKTWETGHRIFKSKAAARRYAQTLANKSGNHSVHVSEKGSGTGGALSFDVWPKKKKNSGKRKTESRSKKRIAKGHVVKVKTKSGWKTRWRS
jgi:hypothetical protein